MFSCEVNQRLVDILSFHLFKYFFYLRIFLYPTYCDYYIQTTTEYILMQSVWFSYQPRESVSYNRITCFFTHGNPESIMIQAVFPYEHYKKSVCFGLFFIINSSELIVFFKAFGILQNVLIKKTTLWCAVIYLNYTVSLCLPLRRLACKTLRPFAVLILFLNPWTLFLCLTFGWYVIHIINYLLILLL